MDVQKFLREVGKANPYAKVTGIELLEIKKNYAKGILNVSEENLNIVGSVHGAALFNLCDSICNYAAYTTGSYVTSISGDINFLNPALDTKCLYCESKVVKDGRRVIVCLAKVYDERDNIIVTSTQTYARLDEKIELNI